MTTEPRKDDCDKLPLDLIPVESLEEIGVVLRHGAEKYAPRNWEPGMRWGRCYAALLRHLFAWWRGEDRDPDSGLSHLAHAGCCILFLISYEHRRAGTDDRPGGVPR